jgi:hypothetical protein
MVGKKLNKMITKFCRSRRGRGEGVLKWMGDLLMPCVTHEVDGLEIAVEKKNVNRTDRVPRDGTRLDRLPR